MISTQSGSAFPANSEWYQTRICEEILTPNRSQSFFWDSNQRPLCQVWVDANATAELSVPREKSCEFKFKIFFLMMTTQLTSIFPTYSEWYQARVCEEILTPNRPSFFRDSNQRPLCQVWVDGDATAELSVLRVFYVCQVCLYMHVFQH